MKIKQLQLNLDAPAPLTVSDILPGNVIQTISGKAILMRVKVTGFLLNSNIVADVLNRGDCFVVNLEKGTLYVIAGDTEVTKLVSQLTYTKE